MILGEFQLTLGADASERVEINCQPTVVLGQQTSNEITRRARTGANQVLPIGFRGSTARNFNSSRTNAYLAAIEIQVRSQRQELL